MCRFPLHFNGAELVRARRAEIVEPGSTSATAPVRELDLRPLPGSQETTTPASDQAQELLQRGRARESAESRSRGWCSDRREAFHR